MRKLIKFFLLFLFVSVCNSGIAQVTYQSDIFHVGKTRYTPIYIGAGWGIDEEGAGLNFWKPFGTANWGNYKLFISQAGLVGIGRNPTNHKLEVAGNIWTSGTFVTSDERLKSDIKSLDRISCLDKLSLLNGKSYYKNFSPTVESPETIQKMIESGKIKSSDNVFSAEKEIVKDPRIQFGFIAQELEGVFPELVDKNEEGIYSIDYTSLIPVIIEGMKELREMMEEKDEKIRQLEAIITGSAEQFAARSEVVTSNAFLYQVAPKVYSQHSVIKYVLPENYTSASIMIHAINGSLVKQWNVVGNNPEVQLEGASLSPGVFVYSLVVDGQKVDSKKMVITN